MIPFALAAGFATAQCPGYAPGDTYPMTMLQGCPAPVSGLLYGLGHEDADREAAAALMGARYALHDLQQVADEHAAEVHPVVYVAGGAVLGAGLAWLAMSVAP